MTTEPSSEVKTENQTSDGVQANSAPAVATNADTDSTTKLGASDGKLGASDGAVPSGTDENATLAASEVSSVSETSETSSVSSSEPAVPVGDSEGFSPQQTAAGQDSDGSAGSSVAAEPAAQLVSDTVVSDTAASDTVASDMVATEAGAVTDESHVDGKSKIAIGSQREGTVVTEPKAVAQAKAQAASADPSATVTAEVRSSIGLDESEVDLSLDDATLGSMMSGNQSDEKGSDELVVDQKYQGKVVRLNDENVFVLIKERFDGIIPTRSFKKKPAEGDLLEVVVTRHNVDEGIYELRIPGGAVDVAAWDDLVIGSRVEVKITGSNTGGLECILNGIRGFIPGSQIDIARVENFGDYVGKKMELVIQEVNKKKRKLILSRKAILAEEQKEKQKEFMETVEVGATFEGTVTRLMDFGAFIDIGNGVEGMAHVSKLSWDRIKHPKDAVAVGQVVNVKVDKINKENGKISLSVKDTMTNPWYGIAEKYPDGTVLKGKVSKLAEFGAFVTLEPGVDGMVHISELAHARVSTVQSVVSVGEEIDVKVLSIDIKKRRIALSRKATIEAPVDKSKPREEKPAVEEKAREMAVKPTREVLKGGRGQGSGGEQFGLRW